MAVQDFIREKMLQIKVRKYISVAFTFFFSIVITGTPMQFQYCMNKLVAVGLQGVMEKHCSNCESNNLDGKCCSIKQEAAKLDKAFQVQKTDLPAAPVLTLVNLTPDSSNLSMLHDLRFQKQPGNKAPPIAGNIPLFIRNRTIRV
jgi:hypothetical protein